MAAVHPSSRRPQSPAKPSSEPQDVRLSHRHRRRLHHGCHGHPEQARRPPLPHGAHPLSRWDFAAFQPVFAHYLDLQRRLRLSDLSTSERRCRWRCFVSRWNRGGLPDGWYRPQMCLQVVRAQSAHKTWRQHERDGGQETKDESLVHSDDSDSLLDHDSDHSDHSDVLCRDQRAEHYARLRELLPRISSRDGAAAASPADCSSYRRMLVALQRRRQRQGAASETVECETV